MGDKIFIADKPTLDDIKAIVEAQGTTALSGLQQSVLSQTQANRLDANVSSRQANWGATTTHRDRIDATISSRATQSSLNSLHTKVDGINTAVSSGGGGIKSVQRGMASVSSDSRTVNISSVNRSKSFLTSSTRANEAHINGMSMYATTVRFNSSTELSFQRSSAIGTAYVSWEVVEFE